MQEIYVENIRRVLKNKDKLEKELEIKITNKGKNVFVDGEADKEYLAIEVLEAINLDFSVDQALVLKQENMLLQKLNIKDITKRQDLERVRARIIGTHGKTLKTLTNLTDCLISLEDNQVGIIGHAEDIEEAVQALTSLIQGSKQGNVYARVEREKKKKRKMPMNIVNELE
jgi:KH domain-containing protein